MASSPSESPASQTGGTFKAEILDSESFVAQQNAKKNPPELMFVNISSNNAPDSSSLPDVSRREINRRVQQVSFQKRRQAAVKRLKTTPASSPAPPPRALVKRPKASVGKVPTPEEEAAVEECKDDIASWRGSRSPSTVSRGESSLLIDIPSIKSYLNSTRMDPFNTGSLEMNSHMENLFMYYFTVIMPVVEPIQSERDDYNSFLLPLVASEPALLYSMLATMAYDIEQASDNGFGPVAKMSRVSERVQYKIKAVQALNHCLADEKLAVQPATLLSVHFLLWQEIFAGDDCVHLDGVLRLLELRGGFDGLQRKATEAIMVGSFWRAIRTRTRPLLPRVLETFHLSPERFTSILEECDPSLAKIGSAPLESRLTVHFDPEFIDLLEDTRKMWICFERIHHFSNNAEKRGVSIKRINVDHRLLSSPFDHYSEDERPIQEVIRQALVIFSTAHYMVVQPASKIANALIWDLKQALGRTDLRNCWGEGGHQALLWVLFLGAHMTAGQRERPWFVMALARVALLLGERGRDWMRVRGILVRFYYVDRVFQESFRRIWDEVEMLASAMPGWF